MIETADQYLGVLLLAPLIGLLCSGAVWIIGVQGHGLGQGQEQG